MKIPAASFIQLFLVAATLVLDCRVASAQLHRATRLGNPATRFAPPLYSPNDLRARFRDEKLRPDFIAVLDQWGWQGNPADMFNAAATNEIADINIPIGERMPFMSTRENGRPICLRDVLWAGKEPAPAYAFNFTSKGRRYRCVTPKACSNFFLEDLGPEPKPLLSLVCNTPAEVTTGRAATICLTLINHGNAPAPQSRLTLPIPAGARVASKTDFATVFADKLVWEMPALEPSKGKQVCATFKLSQPGSMRFAPELQSAVTNLVSTSCETRVTGVPAILLEVIDLDDPVEIGKEVTYEIKVTNQGTSSGTNIKLSCHLPESQQYVSATGTTPAFLVAGTLEIKQIADLKPKETASWLVKVLAKDEDDARFRVELTSDQFTKPIVEDESTHLY